MPHTASRGPGRPPAAKAAETRERILRAAREVFSELGYDAATFQAIAIRADLTAAIPQLAPYHQQSSGAISSLAWADGLARIPAGTQTPPGAEVAWYALADWLR